MIGDGRFAFACLLAQFDVAVVAGHPAFQCFVGATDVDFSSEFAFSLVDNDSVPADVVVATFLFMAVARCSAIAWFVHEVQ